MKQHHIVLDARLQATGIERYANELIRHIGALDHVNRYTVLCRDPKRFPDQPSGWKFLKTDIGHYSLAEQRRLPKLLRTLKPDLVHFTHFNSPIFYTGARVTTIHDLTLHFFPGNRMKTNPLRNFAYKLVMRSAAHSSKKIFAPSLNTKRDIERVLGVAGEKVIVTPEGVDEVFERAQTITKSRAQTLIEKKFNIPSPFILYVGVWSEHKNLERLVEAYEELCSTSRTPGSSGTLNHRLVIAGTPNPQYPHIMRRIERSAYRAEILTPGFIPEGDLPTLYRAAAVFTFVSLYEGFGLPVLEAQAAGTPVVASNTTSIPEVGGKALVAVDPMDTHAIARGIQQLLGDQDLYQATIQAGIKNAQRFKWEATARATYMIYQALLGEV